MSTRNGQEDLKILTDLFAEHVANVVTKDRHRAAKNVDKLVAINEELTRLERALRYCANRGEAEFEVWTRAVHVAALALRIATEASASMAYEPHKALKQLGINVREPEPDQAAMAVASQ